MKKNRKEQKTMGTNFNLLRHGRESAGFSLAKLASICKDNGFSELDESRLSRIERGVSNLNQEQLAFLMHFLQINPNEFFTEKKQ